jgi:tetratricopeptide (TPR) repeat protein
MKKILPLFAALLCLFACNRAPKTPTSDELALTIDSVEKQLAGVYIENVDTNTSNRIVELYVQYADLFPSDTAAPVYLHKAAQWAESMGRIDDMVQYYNRVIENYPNYSKLDECFYSKGIALDNAGRKEEARKAYMEFLDEYPDHFLADDIRKAIALLDMSDEMLLKFLSSQE